MALKRKADEALTGLFGEYASDDDVSGEDEGACTLSVSLLIQAYSFAWH